MGFRHEPFTDRARHALLLAEEEARSMSHSRKGTEHLLLGLLREGDGLAASVLEKMGMRLSEARSTVEWILGRGSASVGGELGWSPRATKVLDMSVVEEANRFNHPRVGTEHLLLGIIREGRSIPPDQGKGIAAGVLETRGLQLRLVQGDVLRAMGVEPAGNDDFQER